MMSTEKQACHDEEAQADTLKKEMKIKEGGWVAWGADFAPSAQKPHSCSIVGSVLSGLH